MDRSLRGNITTHSDWPSTLQAEALQRLSQRFPSCTETWAYAHCLTTHRALSRWVVLLHSPDEYVVAPGHAAAGGALAGLLERLEAGPGVARLDAVSLARG